MPQTNVLIMNSFMALFKNYCPDTGKDSRILEIMVRCTCLMGLVAWAGKVRDC